MAALFAVPAGALSDRFGQRVVGAPGAILFALGAVWWVVRRWAPSRAMRRSCCRGCS